MRLDSVVVAYASPGSSNVPSRSITPQVAIATSAIPTGTPTRSWPFSAMSRYARMSPSNAVRPPRTSRSGLPRGMSGDRTSAGATAASAVVGVAAPAKGMGVAIASVEGWAAADSSVMTKLRIGGFRIDPAHAAVTRK